MNRYRTIFAALALLALGAPLAHAKQVTLMNVSYDPTRELYEQYNAAFAKYWKAKTGDDVTIKQSHGGSGKMRHRHRRPPADVVTLALAATSMRSQGDANCCRSMAIALAQQLPLHVDDRFLVRKGIHDIRYWATDRPALRRHAESEDFGLRALNYLASWAGPAQPDGSEATAK